MELSCNRMTSSCSMYIVQYKMNVNINIDRASCYMWCVYDLFNLLLTYSILQRVITDWFFTVFHIYQVWVSLRYNFDMICIWIQSSHKRTKIIEKWNFLEEEDEGKKMLRTEFVWKFETDRPADLSIPKTVSC